MNAGNLSVNVNVQNILINPYNLVLHMKSAHVLWVLFVVGKDDMFVATRSYIHLSLGEFLRGFPAEERYGEDKRSNHILRIIKVEEVQKKLFIIASFM